MSVATQTMPASPGLPVTTRSSSKRRQRNKTASAPSTKDSTSSLPYKVDAAKAIPQLLKNLNKKGLISQYAALTADDLASKFEDADTWNSAMSSLRDTWIDLFGKEDPPNVFEKIQKFDSSKVDTEVSKLMSEFTNTAKSQGDMIRTYDTITDNAVRKEIKAMLDQDARTQNRTGTASAPSTSHSRNTSKRGKRGTVTKSVPSSAPGTPSCKTPHSVWSDPTTKRPTREQKRRAVDRANKNETDQAANVSSKSQAAPNKKQVTIGGEIPATGSALTHAKTGTTAGATSTAKAASSKTPTKMGSPTFNGNTSRDVLRMLEGKATTPDTVSIPSTADTATAIMPSTITKPPASAASTTAASQLTTDISKSTADPSKPQLPDHIAKLASDVASIATAGLKSQALASGMTETQWAESQSKAADSFDQETWNATAKSIGDRWVAMRKKMQMDIENVKGTVGSTGTTRTLTRKDSLTGQSCTLIQTISPDGKPIETFQYTARENDLELSPFMRGMKRNFRTSSTVATTGVKSNVSGGTSTALTQSPSLLSKAASSATGAMGRVGRSALSALSGASNVTGTLQTAASAAKNFKGNWGSSHPTQGTVGLAW